MIKKLTFCLLSLSLLSPVSNACTLWASVGTVNQTDQLLFIKNRDAPANEVQRLQLVQPPTGYRYLALMYKNEPSDKAYNFISAGINQLGLNVADNDVNTDVTYGAAAGSNIMQAILRHYSTVADVLKDQQALFSHGAGQNLMIADNSQVVMVEIAPAGHYAISRIQQPGYLYHTNHYVNASLVPFNDPVSSSTFMRYNRISQLLATHTAYNTAMFESFSTDQSTLTADGAIDTNDNILRKWTVATWLVAAPKDGPPTLQLKEFNPHQAKDTINLVLDQAFWQQTIPIAP